MYKLKRFDNSRLGISILLPFLHFCCIQRCTFFRDSEFMHIFSSEKRKSDFNDEFRPGTIAIAPTRYPFRRFDFMAHKRFLYSSCCNIQQGKNASELTSGSSPLQSAPRAFFCPETVAILRSRNRPGPGSRSGGLVQIFRKIFPPRIFLPHLRRAS